MKRELSSWYSPALDTEMPIAMYGDYGFALLVPTAAADYLEYERFQMMDPQIGASVCLCLNIKLCLH